MDTTDAAGAASDRRGFLTLGAGAAAAGLVAAGASPAQTGAGALPNLYPLVNAREFRAIRQHENDHLAAVSALIRKIGGTPRPKPNFKNFNPTDARTFATMSRLFANVGTGANRAVAPVIFSRQVLDSAASIATIEGRHAGYLNTVLNNIHTVGATDPEQQFERALTQQEVVNLLSPYIQDFAGGPAPAFGLTPSRVNDVAVLNFAIIIEYLESEFYNLNVPRFFPT